MSAEARHPASPDFSNFRGRRKRRSEFSILDRLCAGFAGGDAHRVLDGDNEDFAVADAAGVGSLLDRLDGADDEIVFYHELDFHFGLTAEDSEFQKR